MPEPGEQTIEVSHAAHIADVRREARTMADRLGFDAVVAEEIALVAGELASNLVRHAGRGTLSLSPGMEAERTGMLIESLDDGPGIADIEVALTDGFSTAGGLGYGLGAVNRLMDTFDIASTPGRAGGTRIRCARWLRASEPAVSAQPLEFGAATRALASAPHNGDSFVLKRWGSKALAAIIDGVGHGEPAQQAAQTARQYVERHYDLPLTELFLGTHRACRGGRGVVMAVARFDLAKGLLTFASIGNIEGRLLGPRDGPGFIVRRGILGANAPRPVATDHAWRPGLVLVLHSDGLRSHWRPEEFPDLGTTAAATAAHRLLETLATGDDDATVVVVQARLPLPGARPT